MASTDQAFMLSLPSELLCEIFTHCVDFSSTAPLVLRTVCRLFFGVIEVTPSLWRRLNLHIGEWNGLPRAGDKARWWFSKVGGTSCLMDVAVDLITPSGLPRNTVEAEDLIAALGDAKRSIGSLEVTGWSVGHITWFLDEVYSTPLSFPPRLPNLHLTICAKDESAPLSARLRIPPSVPTLSNLILLIPSSLNITSLDFSILRTLNITRPIGSIPLSMLEVHDLFSATPVLQVFHLETRLEPDPPATSPVPPPSTVSVDPQPQATIRLPILHSLSLRTNNNPLVLSAITSPSLQTLRLTALDGQRRGRAKETAEALKALMLRMMEAGPDDDHTAAPSDIKARDVPIEVLELSGVGIRHPTNSSSGGARNELWEWCLRRMVHLRDLTVCNMNVSHLLELLIPVQREAEDIPCPSLLELSTPVFTPSVSASLAPTLAHFMHMRPNVRVRYLPFTTGDDPHGEITSSEEAPHPHAAGFTGKEMTRTQALSDDTALTNEDTILKKSHHGLPTPATSPTHPPSSTASTTKAILPPATHAQHSHTSVPPTTTTIPPTSLRVIAPVGGFGFGSHFSRLLARQPFVAARSTVARQMLAGADELF